MMVPSARRVQPLGASSLARVASSAPRAPRAFRILETRARGASIARLAPARLAPAAADSHFESVKLPRWEGERLGWPERRRGGCERGLNRRRVRADASPPSSPSPSEVAATQPDDEPPSGGIAGFFKQLDGLWGQLVPMAFMFYWMALANGILDALKDTLVVTAFGGAEQIPYLTVYAVLPASLAVVGLFARVNAMWGREKLFYVFLGIFMTFFAAFTVVLYPNAAALHPTAWAANVAATLPQGIAGGIAVLTNWTYSLFYVSSELWGDVILSLLFWGMANETTRLQDASIIYPLLGVGANIAQASSGALVRWVSTKWVPGPGMSVEAVWGAKLRLLMSLVMLCGVGIAATHAYIMHRAHQADGGVGRAAAKEAALAARKAHEDEKAENAALVAAGKEKKKAKTGLLDALQFVLRSPEVLCLAIMSVSQGLSSILFQVAWKGQLRILHPSPAEYSAAMGDVQLASGTLTCVLMVCAPYLFRKLGWAGTLGVTPKSAMLLGWAFFGASIWMANAGHLVISSPLLPYLVWGGSLLYVIERAAKFSLFKPAEEMVYITLDDESRTKGKAAVDVLGAQMGKTGGSFLQQGLLLYYGTIVAALPMLMLGHTGIVFMWLWAVKKLDDMHGSELAMVNDPHALAEAEDAKAAAAAAGKGEGEGGAGGGGGDGDLKGAAPAAA